MKWGKTCGLAGKRALSQKADQAHTAYGPSSHLMGILIS